MYFYHDFAGIDVAIATFAAISASVAILCWFVSRISQKRDRNKTCLQPTTLVCYESKKLCNFCINENFFCEILCWNDKGKK
jgi:hypothetical protein